jgi:hypothetical protein
MTDSTTTKPNATKQRAFHALTAGATTIMPDGQVIRFGGSIEQVEGGTKVGRGTYTTDKDAEISWLVSLCKQPSPQIWEEIVEAGVVVTGATGEAPQKVEAGLPADKAAVAGEIVARAETAIDPKIAKLVATAASNAAASSTTQQQ